MPDNNTMYFAKDACRTFCLRESDLEGVDYTSQRNFMGPMPVRTYKGSDLLKAAEDKYVFTVHTSSNGQNVCARHIEILCSYN